MGMGAEGRVIGVNEVHLEEDAGKMIHSGEVSLIDFNRTGTPLLEIVTKPDLRSATEAEQLLQQMQQIVRYLSVSDGNMEEGSLRCDANVSISLATSAPELPAYKVEIKNMNSSRFVRLALEYEIARQTDLLRAGTTPAQETRLWNENRDITVVMRSKEESMDYRYFPEPDLPVFAAGPQFLKQVERQIVELPVARAQRMATEHHLTAEHAAALCADKATADYFEACVADKAPPQLVYSWVVGELRKQLNHRHLQIDRSPATAPRLAELLRLLSSGEIHGKIAKQVLAEVLDQERTPQEIIDEHGWKVLRGAALQQLVKQVLTAHPQVAAQVRNGEKRSIGFLIGQVMQQSEGQADPQETNRLLHTLL